MRSPNDRPMYYHRDGSPIVGDEAWREWAQSFEHDDRKVRRTRLWWGGCVSTVYLGLDHSFMGGPPLIFESMVFGPGATNDWEMDRYSTEEEAIRGHWAMVKRWQRPGLRFLLKCYWEEARKLKDYRLKGWYVYTFTITLLGRRFGTFRARFPAFEYYPLPGMQRAMFEMNPDFYMRVYRRPPPPTGLDRLRAAVLSLYKKSKRRVK